jgi:energy-coupling factor transport system ATP-binding protein
MVTHSMEEIARNVDRIVVFSGGKIAMEGTPKQIFSRSGELSDMGLSVPDVTKIALRLQELAFRSPATYLQSSS